MLRLFVLILLLANGAYFAWSHDLLADWGLGPVSQSEPQRLAQQIEPQRIQILKNTDASAAPKTTPIVNNPGTATVTSTSAAPSLPAQAMATSVCLQAGGFNEQQGTVLKQALAANLPAGTWRLDTMTLPARWIVYMGKYPDDKTRDLKKTQLNRIKVPFEPLTEKTLEPGLSLGRHDNQEAANQALNQLFKQGVRTARVLQEQPEHTGFQLVLPAVDPPLRAKLATMQTQLAGKLLLPCKG
jgi:hypothetical protein